MQREKGGSGHIKHPFSTPIRELEPPDKNIFGGYSSPIISLHVKEKVKINSSPR